MKLFRLKNDSNNYRTCYLEGTKLTDDILFNFLSGKEIFLKSTKMTLVYAKDETTEPGDLKLCWDFCGFIISKKAAQIFQSYNSIKCQYLLLQDDFILFNNLYVIDVLDYSNTIFEYNDGEIFGVEKYSFQEKNYPLLFQIKLPSGIAEMDYFVTEEFIKIVEENDLKGFLFEEVWDSEKE